MPQELQEDWRRAIFYLLNFQRLNPQKEHMLSRNAEDKNSLIKINHRQNQWLRFDSIKIGLNHTAQYFLVAVAASSFVLAKIFKRNI